MPETRKFRCLWVEDRPDEVGEVISAMNDDGDWAIRLVESREQMLAEIELGNRNWDVVVLDGRMAAEHGSNPEEAGRNIFLDLRDAEFGEWGRTVPIILYSGIAEVLERISRVVWPEPAPIVISKNERTRVILQRFTQAKATILGAPRGNVGGSVLFVGAGRIGLGVGVSLITDAGNSSLILFNRFSSGSSKALKDAAMTAHQQGRHLVVEVPGKQYSLAVWFDGLGEHSLQAAIQQCVSDKSILLVLSDSDLCLRAVQKSCSIWMCAVGPALESVIDRLGSYDLSPNRRIDIVALENDHEEVRRISKKLLNVNPSLALYPAVVDRICSEVVAVQQGVKIIGGIEYELCTLKTPATEQIFNEHPFVQLVETDRALEFRHTQKAHMVNLLHWIIAVVRANKVIGRVRSLEELDAQFMETTSDTALDKQVYVTFARLLALKVVFDTEDKLLREAYPNLSRELVVNRLHEHGLRTISRAARTPDRISRIIKGSSSEAFRTRYAKNFDSLMRDLRIRKDTYFARLKSFLSITDRTIEQRIGRVEIAAQEVRRLLEQLEGKQETMPSPGR